MIAEFLESSWACRDQNSRRKLDDGSRIKIIMSDLYFTILWCKKKSMVNNNTWIVCRQNPHFVIVKEQIPQKKWRQGKIIVSMSLSKQIEHVGILGEGDLSSESIVATTADASSRACDYITRWHARRSYRRSSSSDELSQRVLALPFLISAKQWRMRTHETMNLTE